MKKFSLEELPEQVTRLSRKAVSDALEALEKAGDGLLTAQAVVDTARHPDNPMHKHFLWEDDAAAEQYRLMQARQLIRWVKVENLEDKIKVQKYHSLMTDRKRDGGGYRETSAILKNKKLIAELEDTAQKELEAWQRRHAVLQNLCDIVKRTFKI